jgi:primase-polymerase (primpol)-like protein
MIDSSFLQTFKQEKRWLLWREEDRKGKRTKVPYSVSGSLASSTNPETWSDYNSVLTARKRYHGLRLRDG